MRWVLKRYSLTKPAITSGQSSSLTANLMRDTLPKRPQ